MNRDFFFKGIMAFFMFGLIGCGTIMHGTKQQIGISSNPSGAKVVIDRQHYGITPFIADLSRKDNHVIRIEMEGFIPYETTLTRRVSGWVWGNIVFGGLIGLAVDAISGGLYKLTPDQVQAELAQNNRDFSVGKGNIFIIATLKPDPHWELIGKMKEK